MRQHFRRVGNGYSVTFPRNGILERPAFERTFFADISPTIIISQYNSQYERSVLGRKFRLFNRRAINLLKQLFFDKCRNKSELTFIYEFCSTRYFRPRMCALLFRSGNARGIIRDISRLAFRHNFTRNSSFLLQSSSTERRAVS